jgi:peptidoglycan/xylan/chitin deacetylase (PgdA/CDA1 family)
MLYPARGDNVAASRLKGIPVLVYHGLTKTGSPELPLRERKYWVTTSEIQEQIKEIRHGRYDVINLQNWFGLDRQVSPSVAITFDDGRVSDYETALPLLLENGLTATFFVNTSKIGSLGYLNWSQVRNMQKHGMSFQSHSHDHVYLTRLSRPALEDQLRRSRRALQDALGRRIDLLAPPFGRFNDRVVDAAHLTGYI